MNEAKVASLKRNLGIVYVINTHGKIEAYCYEISTSVPRETKVLCTVHQATADLYRVQNSTVLPNTRLDGHQGKKVKFSLEQATNVRKGSRGIALLFL